MEYITTYDRQAARFLGRGLTASDAIPAQSIRAAESRLGCSLPKCLSVYYSVAGNCEEFNSIHNRLLSPDDLEFDGSYLVFMHENQGVVSWGFRREDLADSHPIVWQRNNTPPIKWYSEELHFADFLQSMFEWYEEIGVWTIESP